MQTEKKQLLIYVIVAYGITYVQGLLMWYGYGKDLDLSAFPKAQMLYPAAGVMMAYLITKKEDKNTSKDLLLYSLWRLRRCWLSARRLLFWLRKIIDLMGTMFSSVGA